MASEDLRTQQKLLPTPSVWWGSYRNERKVRMEGVWKMENSVSINFGRESKRESKWIGDKETEDARMERRYLCKMEAYIQLLDKL